MAKLIAKKSVSTPAPVNTPAPKAKGSKTAPVATAATAEPKTPKTPKVREASKFVSADEFEGRRMRVAEYQDYTFSINDAKGRQLTDEELAADWRRQFPNAVAFTTAHVGGARRDYNKGIHSKAFPGKHDAAPWFLNGTTRTQAAPPKAKADADAPAPSVKTFKAKAAPAPVAAPTATKKSVVVRRKAS